MDIKFPKICNFGFQILCILLLACLGSTSNAKVQFVLYPFTSFYQLLVFVTVCSLLSSFLLLFAYTSSLKKALSINWKLVVSKSCTKTFESVDVRPT